MALIISPKIAQKIASEDHGKITSTEVEECFENHCGGYCQDTREQHAAGDPALATLWFVGETNHRRRLKIVFVRDEGDVYLKSAYPATPEIERIFKKYQS